jgi:Lipid A core - O-antigen ligase and related enzymes
VAELLDRSGSSGTYVNRNHLAGMIELALPLSLALFVYNFGSRFQKRKRAGGVSERVLAVLKSGNRPSLVFILLVVLFTVGIVVTRSRSGIALAMLGILVTAIFFSRRIGGRGTFGLVGQLVAISVGVAVFLGLAPVLDRFSVATLEGNARWDIAGATFDAAGVLLPFGSGPGTFADVFVLYQPLSLGRWFINYAHNDYLQTLFEMGLPGAALIGLFLVLYLAHWPRLLTQDEWSGYRSVHVGAGIAIFVVCCCTALTDNNLRNPANMAYFALVAAVYYAPAGPAAADRARPHAPAADFYVGESRA